MPSPDHRHWNGRLAGDGPREARGPTSQDRIARPPNKRSHRGAEKASSRNERHPSRDVLTAETPCVEWQSEAALYWRHEEGRNSSLPIFQDTNRACAVKAN